MACIMCAGAKWDAKAYGRPRAAASCAPNRLEPRIQTGTRRPAPGHRAHALAGLRARRSTRSAPSRPAGTRRSVSWAPRRSAAAVGLVGARRAADAEVDAAGEERLQGAELLGDHQRRVVGQHDAARADADGGRARRRRARSRPRSPRWRSPACCGARPASSGGSPSASACRARSRVLRNAAGGVAALHDRGRGRGSRAGPSLGSRAEETPVPRRAPRGPRARAPGAPPP